LRKEDSHRPALLSREGFVHRTGALFFRSNRQPARIARSDLEGRHARAFIRGSRALLIVIGVVAGKTSTFRVHRRVALVSLPASGYAQTRLLFRRWLGSILSRRRPLVYRLRLDREKKELTRAQACTNVAVF